MKLKIFLFTALFIPSVLYAQYIEPGTHSNRGTGTYYDMTNPPPDTDEWDSSPYQDFTLRNSNGTHAMNFRLLLPEGYDPQEDKEYPMLVFYHGAGESGVSWGAREYDENTDPKYLNNDHNLYHGGYKFLEANQRDESDLRSFNGFVLVGQNASGWYSSMIDNVATIIDLLVAQDTMKVDRFRIYATGLSNGGTAVWGAVSRRPDLFAAIAPISGVITTIGYEGIIHVPTWLFQGGFDNNPTPYQAQKVIDSLKFYGASPLYTIYPNQGHSIWNTAWEEPDFYSWLKSHHKLDIFTYFGDTAVCPGEPVSIKIGVSPGFEEYQWHKDGVPIPSSDSHDLLVTEVGDYQVRVKYNGEWSELSSVRSISVEAPTPAPEITAHGSTALPDLEGAGEVTLSVPSGFESYSWRNESNDLISEDSYVTVSQEGTYKVAVSEAERCESIDREIYVSVNGSDPPVSPSGFLAIAQSSSEVSLSWKDESSNETGFEIYRSMAPTGPFDFIGRTDSNETHYTDKGLSDQSVYFYAMRSYNDGGASDTISASTATLVDKVAPSVPTGLSIRDFSPEHVVLQWDENKSDEGVDYYEVYYYRNGNISGPFPVQDTTMTISDLDADQLYRFFIRAVDLAGNVSKKSENLSVYTQIAGVRYKLYLGGTWGTVSEYEGWPVSKEGFIPNFNINTTNATPPGVRAPNDVDYFAFDFEGKIILPEDAWYTFYTSSDDGSLLYIDGDLVVNNDGMHANVEKEGGKYLTKGAHDIKVQYFERTGGQNLTVSIKNNQTLSKQTIPDGMLKSSEALRPVPPAAPSDLNASTALESGTIKVDLSWTDNSYDELEFEVFRSKSPAGPFSFIGAAKSNITAFSDSTVEPSETYYYRVRSSSENGESGYAVHEQGITTGPGDAIPAVPSEVNIRISGSYPKLLWKDNSPDESGFIIKRSTVSGGPYFVVGEVSANVTDYTDNNSLIPGKKYYYVVHSFNSGGVSAGSEEVNIDAPDIPIAPTELELVMHPASNEIALNWKDNSLNEEEFLVERSISRFTGFTPLAEVGEGITTYTDNTADKDKKYYYRVRASNVSGKSEASNIEDGRLPAVYTQINIIEKDTDEGYSDWSSEKAKWNNMPFDDGVFENGDNYSLDDPDGNATGYILEFTANWTGDNSRKHNGYVTEEIPFQGTVIKTNYELTGEAHLLTFKGLDPDYSYKISFLGNRVSISKEMYFSIDGEVISIDTRNNTDLVVFNDIKPVSGEIEVELGVSGSSKHAYLNAITLEAYTEKEESVYYSKAFGDLNKTSTWGSAENGTGSAPDSFHGNERKYIINNRALAELEQYWGVSGESSEIIVSSGSALSIENNASLSGKLSIGENGTLILKTQSIPDVTLDDNSTVVFAQNTSTNIPVIDYYNLELKNGNKILPGDTLRISGNFVASGEVSGVTASVLDLKGSATFKDGAVTSPSSGFSLNYSGTGASELNLKSPVVYLNSLSSVSDCELEVTGGTNRLDLSGDLDIAGPFSADSTEFSFTGAGREISGALSIYKLTVNDNSSASLASGYINLMNALKLHQNSTFNTNDSLTLVSNAKGTGSIARIESGAVLSGNITAQRYMGPSKTAGYSYFGTSLLSQTYGDWDDDLDLRFGGRASTGYTWEESTSTWNPISSKSSAIEPGTGVAHYFFGGSISSGSVTIDNFGEPFTGDLSLALSKEGEHDDGGWHLVSNPYPSAIDWDQVGRDNVSGSYHVWNNEEGKYESYVTGGGGAGTGDIGSEIPSGQAFYVHAEQDGAELHFSENDKVSESPTFFRRGRPASAIRVFLTYEDKNVQEELILRVNNEATEGYDYELDAFKLDGDHFNLSAETPDSLKLAISTLPEILFDKKVQLFVSPFQKGRYAFDFENIVPFKDYITVEITDHYTDETFPVKAGEVYHFEVNDDPASFDERRFSVKFIPQKVYLSGVIKTTEGLPLAAGISVRGDKMKQEVITNGDFKVEVDAGYEYEVTPSMYPTVYTPDLVDLVQINRIVQRNSASLSPYQVVAADVNDDRRVNKADYSFLLNRMVSSYGSAGVSEPWIFLSESLSSEKKYSVDSSKSVYPEADMDNVNFIGVQKGNIYTKETPVGNASGEGHVTISSTKALPGETASVAVKMIKDFKNAEGYQLQVRYDPRDLVFEGVSGGKSSPDIQADKNEGVVNIIWVHPYGLQKTFYKGENLFSLQFTTTGKSGDKTTIAIEEDQLPFMFVRENEGTLSSAVSGNITTSGITGIYPAPFQEEFSVKLDLPSSGKGSFSVLDLSGKEIYTESSFLTAGENIVTITSLNDINPGVYILEFNFRGFITRKKIIKI